MKIAIQMDHPASLNAAGDSTIALALEAQTRGYSLFYYHVTTLTHRDGALFAPIAPITFFDETARWFELGEPTATDLATMDVVLMRQDPPFDMGYITATHLLEQLPPSTRVINNPAYVRNHPEKLAILDFSRFIPPTLISRDEGDILAFARAHKKIVIKPLHGFGGRSIYVFAHDDPNLGTFIEQQREQHHEPLMIQQFLRDVATRDVRVILMNGSVSAAVGRIPPDGKIRANFRVGGTAAKVTLNARQQEICDAVGEKLKQNNVLFAGLDLIGDYLTEINITSPTGIRAAQRLYGHDPSVDFWDGVEIN